MRYSTYPLLQRHHFEAVGGHDESVAFGLHCEAPIFSRTRQSEEHTTRLSKCSSITLRELLSDGKFESTKRTWGKLVFFFGDIIEIMGFEPTDDNKWLHKIGDRHFFLSDMTRMVSLAYLQPCRFCD